MFNIQSPLFLILLSLIPLLIFIQLRTNVIAAKWRKRTTFIIRSVALVCAILAIANLQRIHREQRLAVVFLLDISDSIPNSQQEIAIGKINAAIAELKPNDHYGVIGFAEEPSVLVPLGQKDKLRLTLSVLIEQSVETDSTDVISALKRTIEQLPDNYHRRIVLFSDGVQNSGNTSLTEYLPFLTSSDVEIMSIPLKSIQDAIRVERLLLPDKVRKGHRFEIQAVIISDGTISRVNSTLYHNGIPVSDLAYPIKTGRNVIDLPMQQVFDIRTHIYQIKLKIDDEISENNQAIGVVQVQDKPQILYADSDLDQSRSLRQVLEENGFDVRVIHASEIPTDLVSLQQFDVVILSNTDTEMFTENQQQVFESYVRDLGHGLVVTGGDKTFGAGGYTDTTLERILPVDMTPRERKDSVALVFVIDTSGSMANIVGSDKKIDIAIEAIRAGIRNLDAEDQVAVIGFDVVKHVISTLASNHDRLIKQVGKLKPTGGTAAMAEAVAVAIEMQKAAEVKRKHILLLSDGKSTGRRSDIIEIARDAANQQIGITTIAIGDADKDLLKEIADTGQGRAIEVQNIHNLPKVLMDAVRETQNYIIQEEFQPTISSQTSPILVGINNLPLLYGYVATSEKTAAQVLISSHKNEPILAGWHYGLGKSVAWTSDVKTAWSRDWIPWSNFGKFWGQVINWTLPNEGVNADFDLSVSHLNGNGEVVINTKHPSPTSFTVQVAGPNAIGKTVNIQQESTYRHIGKFLMNDRGSYIITAKQEGTGDSLSETISLSYPVEYAVGDANTKLLKTLSEETNGTYQPTIAQITAAQGKPYETRLSLSFRLLIFAVVLFVIEMILRRFSIASGYFAELRSLLRNRKDAVVPATLTQLSEKKVNADTTYETGLIANIGFPTLNQREVDTTIEQSDPGTMTRLLAAKRRSHSA